MDSFCFSSFFGEGGGLVDPFQNTEKKPGRKPVFLRSWTRSKIRRKIGKKGSIKKVSGPFPISHRRWRLSFYHVLRLEDLHTPDSVLTFRQRQLAFFGGTTKQISILPIRGSLLLVFLIHILSVGKHFFNLQFTLIRIFPFGIHFPSRTLLPGAG